MLTILPSQLTVCSVLGTLPLAFSSSDIFSTVFIAFLALVSLGSTHGLILLPVILSIIGPEARITLAADPRQPTKIVATPKSHGVQTILPTASSDDEATV